MEGSGEKPSGPGHFKDCILNMVERISGIVGRPKRKVLGAKTELTEIT